MRKILLVDNTAQHLSGRIKMKQEFDQKIVIAKYVEIVASVLD